MDQIKVKSMNAADVAEELLNCDLPSTLQKEGGLQSLSEWEMALVGGGDGLVCW